METALIAGMFLVLLAAVAPGLYALRKRMAMEGGQLEFWRVLQRRGLGPEDAEDDPRSLGMAIRRCTLCPSVDVCGDWLASGAREGLEDFCPNAEYLRRLERQ